MLGSERKISMKFTMAQRISIPLKIIGHSWSNYVRINLSREQKTFSPRRSAVGEILMRWQGGGTVPIMNELIAMIGKSRPIE